MGGLVGGGGSWPLSVDSKAFDRPEAGSLRTGAGNGAGERDPPRTDEFSSDDKTLAPELPVNRGTGGAAGGGPAGGATFGDGRAGEEGGGDEGADTIMSKKAPLDVAEPAEDEGVCRSPPGN